MSVDRLSVPVDDIEHRIDLENELIFRRDHIQVPHNRDCPNADLQDDIDDLRQVAEENYDRTCPICYAETEYEHADEIVEDLQCVETRPDAVKRRNQDRQHYKERVHEQG